jgi:hypothetical protein
MKNRSKLLQQKYIEMSLKTDIEKEFKKDLEDLPDEYKSSVQKINNPI